MSFSFKSRSSSRSKSREKQPKYIPAAIIPSAAFVINPLIPPKDTNLPNEALNGLLNSTLNSSVLGYSSDTANKIDISADNYSKKKNRKSRKENENFENNEEFVNENDINTNSSHQSRSKRKKRSQTEDSKRHIKLANGLFDESADDANHFEYEKNVSAIDQYPREKRKKQIKEPTENEYFSPPKVSMHNGFVNTTAETSKTKTVTLNLENKDSSMQGSQDNLALDQEYYFSSDHLKKSKKYDQSNEISGKSKNEYLHEMVSESGLLDSNSGKPFIGFEKIDSVTNEERKHRVSIGFEEKMKELTLNSHDNSGDAHSQPYFTEQKHFNNPNPSYVPSQSPTKSENISQSENKKEIKKSKMRLMKEEIRSLQETIYRLNKELSTHIPEGEYGKFIGKTVLPGKGPVPSWLINTRYLTPLFALYDKRYEEMSLCLEKNQIEMNNFKKEILQVIKENERLHLRLQENEKGISISNQSEIQIVVQQAKLVIEENHLLLEELELLQQKIQVYEDNNCTEVAQLKKSLLSITSERDALDEEIKDLTQRLAKLKGSTQPLHSPYQNSSNNQEYGSINDHVLFNQNKIFESQIEELKIDKRKLEKEIELLTQNEKKKDKKLETYKKIMDSEKKFRQYFNNVLEKSDEVVNERNSLIELFEVQDKEITRIANKFVSEINCRTNLDSKKIQVDFRRNKPHELLNKLDFIEMLIDKVLQSEEELRNRSKNQETDICRYQTLLREKDKYLQECQEENDLLEEKLENLLKNAANEY